MRILQGLWSDGNDYCSLLSCSVECTHGIPESSTMWLSRIRLLPSAACRAMHMPPHTHLHSVQFLNVSGATSVLPSSISLCIPVRNPTCRATCSSPPSLSCSSACLTSSTPSLQAPSPSPSPPPAPQPLQVPAGGG